MTRKSSRLALDIAGKTPAVSDVHRFLADQATDKRRRAIERYLDGPGYVRHFSNIWLDLLLPEFAEEFQRQQIVPSMENWLRKQFAGNVHYDRMVHELLTVPIPSNRNMGRAFFNGGNEATPVSFYRAKEAKPEELAAGTARLFLGVRLECAQCHNHPFARWTREQFWGQAAFFAGLSPQRNFFDALTEAPDRRELMIPGTTRVAQASFLDGGEPRWKYKVSARTTLADWLTSPENPFFARAAVNRVWALFFGFGLVDPVDDFRDDNPPSHPELLDELARQFIAHGFDLKFLVKGITLSQTYQRSSRYDGAEPDPRLYARMAVRALSPDQLYDSFVQATGYRDQFGNNQRRFFQNSVRNQFLNRFRQQAKPADYQVSVTQALMMMNNPLIANLTNPDKGEVLAGVAHSPFMTTPERVEALYLSALSRRPSVAEATEMHNYIDRNRTPADKNKALADVFWALLNSSEFMFNH